VGGNSKLAPLIILHPASCILHPASCILHPASVGVDPRISNSTNALDGTPASKNAE